MGRVRTAALALALAGCAKPKPAPAPPVSTPVAPTHASVDAFLSAKGRGADEAAAYASAQASLADALLGDARWLGVVPVALHDRTQDPYDAVSTPEGWEVAIGLDEGRAATTLDAMTYAKPSFEGPEAWHDALYQALATHAAKVVCERRASLYDVACDAPATEQEDAALRELGEGLSLAPLIRGGVPTDTDGVVLRPARVLVTWNGAPMDGVPLVVETPDGSRVDVPTGDGGVAELPVPVGAPWPGTFRVRVDAGRLLGPLEETCVWPSLDLGPRALDPSKWALVFEDGTKADDAFGKALAETLGEALGPPVELDANTSKTLAEVGPAERARVLVSLADAMGGTLDVVVLVKAQSRFASRAGGSRVWFEATSSVVVHEVWGAGELGREEAEATASGVGDRRADDAAQRNLAEQTSSRVLSVLRN
ncbi:MAG: hypothetical protein ACE37F_13585 [Nannocystaceae bacterium]|nr:hypothetical protein [bacterium]